MNSRRCIPKPYPDALKEKGSQFPAKGQAVGCLRWGIRDQVKPEPSPAMSAMPPKDGVIGRPSLWIAEDLWVLRFRLMVKRGPLL
jgi:hypothetical protein